VEQGKRVVVLGPETIGTLNNVSFHLQERDSKSGRFLGFKPFVY
jgi:hypothetical protein